MRIRIAFLTALAAATLALGSPSVAAIRTTPEFKAGETRPVSIAILPVHATAAVARVVQTEGLVEESTEYGVYYADTLAVLLEQKGYQVRVVTAEEVNADPQLLEYTVDANRRYDEMLSQLRPGRIKRRIYNAGDEVKLLAQMLDVDAIAFTRLNVVAPTGGRTAVAVLFGLGGMGGSSAVVGIIDGHTADLEAWVTGAGVSGARALEENPQAVIASIAAATVSRFPDADPDARVEPEADDEAFLEGLEELLE